MASIKKIAFLFFCCITFISCNIDVIELKSRTNPNDEKFERLTFQINSALVHSYVELKNKITFRWRKLGSVDALNPEVWVYRDRMAISKVNSVDLKVPWEIADVKVTKQ